MPILVAGLVIAAGLLGYIALTELYSMHMNRVAEVKHCPPNCPTCVVTRN